MRLKAILLAIIIAGSVYGASTTIETSKMIFTNNSVSIFGIDESNPTDTYTLQDNGISLSAPLNAGNWIKWIRDGNTHWALGTFQGEQDEYLYLHNNQIKQQPLTVSEGGRFGINIPPNIMNYHALWNQIGVDDLEVAGIYTKSQIQWYQVSICNTGIVDYWTWGSRLFSSTNYTPSYVTNNCTTNPIVMDSGITIAFGSTNGHTGLGVWEFPGFPQIPSASLSVRPSIFTEVLTATNKLTNNAVWLDRTFDAGYSGSPAWDGITTTNDVLMVGQNRKGNTIYIGVNESYAGFTTVCEYWTPNGWASVTNMTDNTYGFSIPGSINFEKSYMTNWTKMTPDGESSDYNLYWLRVRSSTTPTSLGNWIEITPQGNLRFAIYVSGLGTTPKMYVDAQGNTYLDRAFRNSSLAYSATELITLTKAQSLIDSAINSIGSTLYMATNVSPNVPPSQSLLSTIPSYSWIVTNAVASGTNTVATFVTTNQFGTNVISAGKVYSVYMHASCAGSQTRAQWQLLSVSAGATNVLYNSDYSSVLSSLDSAITMGLTTPTNITVTDTNYLGVRILGVRTGNAGNMFSRFGSTYGSKLTIGNPLAGPQGPAGANASTQWAWTWSAADLTNSIYNFAQIYCPISMTFTNIILQGQGGYVVDIYTNNRSSILGTRSLIYTGATYAVNTISTNIAVTRTIPANAYVGFVCTNGISTNASMTLIGTY